MRLSASEVDWSKLSERARWALENVIPKLAEQETFAEIAATLDVSREDVMAAHELLEAETQALAGRIVLPAMTEEEYEALKESISVHGQIFDILLGSDGAVVDGRHRLRACRELGIEPRTRTLELPADKLQSLALAVNVARRHLTASARRGIARAELLTDPSRSDRAIAVAAGVDGKTIAALRKGLEATAEIPQLPARTGTDGKTRAAAPRDQAPPPTHVTVRVKVAAGQTDQLLGRWVDCKAFRLVEIRENLYELQVQLLENTAAGADAIADVEGEAAALDALLQLKDGSAIAQLLGDASEIFGRPITAASELAAAEASWCLTRLGELAATVPA